MTSYFISGFMYFPRAHLLFVMKEPQDSFNSKASAHPKTLQAGGATRQKKKQFRAEDSVRSPFK